MKMPQLISFGTDDQLWRYFFILRHIILRFEPF